MPTSSAPVNPPRPDFRDGKITLRCEYDNPLIVQASLAEFAG